MTTEHRQRRPGRSVPLDPAKLTRAREEAGLNMSQLAARIEMAPGRHMSPAHIDGIERGYHGASPAVAKRLALELGLRVADLLRDDEEDEALAV